MIASSQSELDRLLAALAGAAAERVVPCSIVQVNGGWSVAMWLCAECEKAMKASGKDVRTSGQVLGPCDACELRRQGGGDHGHHGQAGRRSI